MSELRRRLYGLLIVALGYVARRENEADRAASLLVDMGYDDCPVCVANRRREAWS